MSDAQQNIEPSDKGDSPTWLAVSAAVTLAGIGLIAVLSLRSVSWNEQEFQADKSTEDGGPPAEAKTETVVLPRPGQGDWVSQLYAPECPAPCAAGKLCETSPDNTAKASRYCRVEKEQCGSCASKMTCIPGETADELAAGEQWSLHLSALNLDRKDKRSRASQPQPCEYKQDFWVCLRPSSGGQDWTCLAQLDACRGMMRSSESLSIVTEDLIGSGLDIEVRYERENGPVLVRQERAGIRDGMMRRGLCSGYKIKVGETPEHDVSFTFFLEPATGR